MCFLSEVVMGKNVARTLIMIVVLLTFPLSAVAAGHTLLIDPAHGGEEAGVKLSRTVHEKDVTLAVAAGVKQKLSRADDITVRLTRSDDGNVSLAARKKILQESDADIIISVHVNAGFGQKAEGYEVYYLPHEPPTTQKDDSGEIVRDMERTRRFNNSVFLAQLIQKNMGRVFPRKGRGVREAPVYLFRSLETPAILLEVGFSTHLDERKKLRDPKVQQAIADALTDSVMEYFQAGGAS